MKAQWKPPIEDLVQSTDRIAQKILQDIKLTLDCLRNNLKVDGTVDRVHKQAKGLVSIGGCSGCHEQATCYALRAHVNIILNSKLAIRTKQFRF